MKSIPWPQIQTYLPFLKTHDTQLAMLIKLKEDNLLGVPEVSQSITKALLQMQETVTKLLSDNNII